MVWSAAGNTLVWDVTTRRPVTPPMSPGGFVFRGALSSDEKRIALSVQGKGCLLWDAETGRQIAAVMRNDSPGSEASNMDWVEFSPDGRMLVTADRGGVAMLWDAETGAQIGRPIESGRRLWMAHFSPDGRRIATAAEDGAVRVWDTATQQPVTPVMRHADAAYTANFSPDGRLLVTASYDLTARVWNTSDGTQVGAPLRHHSGVRWATFSPDGAWIATASSDNNARLWNASTHEPVGEPMTHQGPVWRALFTHDGGWLSTASLDGSARVWAVPSGQPVTEPFRHRGWPTGLAPTPNGRWIGLGESTGGFDLRELPPDGVGPSWLADLAEAVAGERFTENGFEPVPPTQLAGIADMARRSTSNDDWSMFRRWFFADRRVRTISPSSACTVAEWVDDLAEAGGYDVLCDVYRVAPERPGLTAQLANLASAREIVALSRPTEEPDYFRRWLLAREATNAPAVAPQP
jgi:WD domain, G-beta repeat